MRITYLHQYFNTPAMSGGTRSYELARRLVARGHQVTMVTSDVTPGTSRDRGWTKTIEAGIEVWWLKNPYSNKLNNLQRLKSFTRFAWHATHKAASLPTDVIFATSTPLTIAIPGILAKRRLNVPMVFEVRDLWPEVPIAMGAIRNPMAIAAARWLERWAYRSSARVVGLSPQMCDGVLKQGVPPEHVAMIPNSCDLDLFDVPEAAGHGFRQSRPWLGDRPLVVYAGTLGPANGVDYFVRLAAEIRKLNDSIRLLIMGSGKEEQSLKMLAADFGCLNRNLFFEKPVAKAEMPAVLSAATLATSLFSNLPELQANSPNKLFDALAAGRPVAINNGGWIGKLIDERRFGLSLPPTDISGAARQVVGAVIDPTWLRAAGLAARQTARELFDRDRLAEQLEEVFLQAVSADRPATSSHEPAARAA